MRQLRTGALFIAAAALIAGCGQDTPTQSPVSHDAFARGGASGPAMGSAAVETITFAGLPAGTILSEVYGDMGSGPIAVDGHNPILGAVNAAVIFDSANPTGGDDDLGTPNETFGGPGIGAGGELGSPYANDVALGEVLIVAHNLTDANDDDLVDDPNDTAVDNAVLSFDFSAVGDGVVDVHEMALLDVENTENAALVRFFDAGDLLISETALPQTGDNGLAIFDFGPVSGVARMTVTLGGSGAIDNIVFELPGDEPNGDGEGCTPGYWKTHPTAWATTAYAPGDLVKSVWPAAEGYVGDATLMEALGFGGGPGADGAALILLRAATASLLNASSSNVGFDLSVAEIIDAVDTALASGDRGEMLDLATTLDDLNNSGCPLGRDGDRESGVSAN